ncbi:MAG: hypothetical protein L0387_28670 [Acidobacteria bacterium]|nr:hypothetical protein [Acidobacteriota bacterium]MCI0720965.1 hypothetical protein [Acidobacteriota bacterium]
MAELIDEARNLKKLAQTQRQQGEHSAAAKTLREGIDGLEETLAGFKGADKGDSASELANTSERAVATELADLYGILGGTRREQGDLLQAATAYDAGFRYESNPRYGLVSSYNALNRLLTRILLCPGALSDRDSLRKESKLEFVDVSQNLNKLQTQLKLRVEGVSANDFWAAGDLAIVSALNGDDKGAIEALEKFASCSPSPPISAYNAYGDSIGMLAQLDTPRRDALTRAQSWLKDRATSY